MTVVANSVKNFFADSAKNQMLGSFPGTNGMLTIVRPIQGPRLCKRYRPIWSAVVDTSPQQAPDGTAKSVTLRRSAPYVPCNNQSKTLISGAQRTNLKTGLYQTTLKLFKNTFTKISVACAIPSYFQV